MRGDDAAREEQFKRDLSSNLDRLQRLYEVDAIVGVSISVTKRDDSVESLATAPPNGRAAGNLLRTVRFSEELLIQRIVQEAVARSVLVCCEAVSESGGSTRGYVFARIARSFPEFQEEMRKRFGDWNPEEEPET